MSNTHHLGSRLSAGQLVRKPRLLNVILRKNAQQLLVAQVRFMHDKSQSSANEAELLNTARSGRKSEILAGNMRWFLKAFLQKSVEDFFMCFLPYVFGEGSVLRANISNHCDVVMTTVRQRQ